MKTRKIVRILLIVSCVIALLLAGLWVWMEETPDPLTGYYGSKEYDIDRLDIAPFSQGQSDDPVRMITDETLIERYKRAYAWKNSNAICCDEDTTYIFTEYYDGQVVGQESYQSFLFSGYHNIGFRWRQFCLIHQIEPLWIWLGLLFIGLVIGFRKQIRAYWRPALWGSGVTVFGMLACVMLFLFVGCVFEKPAITTWESDPFILNSQAGVLCVIMFAVTTILVTLRYPRMKRIAQAGVIVTGCIAVMSVFVSYRAIYLPLPYIDPDVYSIPTKDTGIFLTLIMGVFVPWAASLALYLVVRRIREKRAQRRNETKGQTNCHVPLE